MKREYKKAKGPDDGELRNRMTLAATILEEFENRLPTTAVRIEIDIEYADGGRVKLEGRQ